MVKIAFTLVWAGILIAANRALDDVTWAQYLATFALGGIYALALSRLSLFRENAAKAPETSR